MDELIEMLEMAEKQEGATIFDFSAEEIGNVVMENHEAVLSALKAARDGC